MPLSPSPFHRSPAWRLAHPGDWSRLRDRAHPRRLRGWRALLAILVAGGTLVGGITACGGDGEGPGESAVDLPFPSVELPAEVPWDPSIQERALVFLSLPGDSTVLVPWAFRTRTRGEVAVRDRGLWLGRRGSWEALLQDTLQTPTTGGAARIVPGGAIRLVVGRDDVVERLLFREGPREVELAPGEFLAEWGNPDGSIFRLHRGSATFPSGAVDGFVLDLLRVWEAGSPPGDWIVLHGGDGVQLLLEERIPLSPSRSPGAFRGWSRVAFQQQPWPDVEVTWEEVRAFEPARRDIPAEWVITTPGGEVEGAFRSVSSHLAAGTGEGPLLPVSAFFEVEGEVRIMGEPFPVQGLVRHLQW